MKNATLLLCFAMTGCGTVINGPYQGIGITTTPAGARCRTELNREFLSPKIIQFTRGAGHAVFCELPGYLPAGATFQTKGSHVIWANLLLGGIPGSLIDVISGAAWKLTPEKANIVLIPATSGSTANIPYFGAIFSSATARQPGEIYWDETKETWLKYK